MNPPRVTERRDVTVIGRTAEFVTAAAGARETNSCWLAISLPDGGAVLLTTNSSHDKDGAELNPLIAEAEFLALAEKLRPYPE